MKKTTIAILYPGEMGSALGQRLSEFGFNVLTTLEGRSPRTHRLCSDTGLHVVDTLNELLKRSSIVISLVSPGAALSVATTVAAHIETSSDRLIYIDANSISPMTITQIAEALRHVPVDLVDASIFGLASQLKQRGTIYFSGSRAMELVTQFGAFPRIKYAGDALGQASALKMIISGIPKGLSALFIETMLFAEEMHLLNEALDACGHLYPNVMEIIARMLPTYPQHAARRCEELKEVEQTMLVSGLQPRILHAALEVTSALADTDWSKESKAPWTIEEVIRRIHSEGSLQTPELTPSNSFAQD